MQSNPCDGDNTDMMGDHIVPNEETAARLAVHPGHDDAPIPPAQIAAVYEALSDDRKLAAASTEETKSNEDGGTFQHYPNSRMPTTLTTLPAEPPVHPSDIEASFEDKDAVIKRKTNMEMEDADDRKPAATPTEYAKSELENDLEMQQPHHTSLLVASEPPSIVRSNTAQGSEAIVTRPPPRSMLPHDDASNSSIDESGAPLFHAVDATVVRESVMNAAVAPREEPDGNIAKEPPLNPKNGCGWDGGDCIEFNVKYPDCVVSSTIIVGDGRCDGGSYNTVECGWDGGDCTEFNEKYPNCQVWFPSSIGDGDCHNVEPYNTVECSWDGGDCTKFNQKYPGCHADSPDLLGDGYCHGEYNSEECGWDGGDCMVDTYPDCHVEYPFDIGDTRCNGGSYNTEECGWDGGDCIEFNVKYPDCDVMFPDYVKNGRCDSGSYNTKECGWDGGDCVEFNENYPDCQVDCTSCVGDGNCHNYEPYNTEQCGWDGGDCIEFNEKYPNCQVNFPKFIGNGECNGGSYNTEECGWDGGDCN